MSERAKPVKLLRKQPPMRRMLIAMIPCICGAVYYFGWRSLALIIVANITTFITEFFFCRMRNEPATEATFVTGTLFALVMPPTVDWHVLIIGSIFAIFFAKEVFGGFGRNIFNPAIAGRAFVYICFPYALTGIWAPPAQQTFGALDRWTTVTTEQAITRATPMAHLKAGRIIPLTNTSFDSKAKSVKSANEIQTANLSKNDITKIPYQIAEKQQFHILRSHFIRSLAFGRISGTMGVTSAILITIGGIYLFITKTASRTIILSVIISYFLFNLFFTLIKTPRFYGPVIPVLGGGFLLGAFYMATDPVSSPKTELGRVFYGIIIALGTTVIRNFSIFNGGLMFSILLGNTFAPIIDYAVKSRRERNKSGSVNGVMDNEK